MATGFIYLMGQFCLKPMKARILKMWYITARVTFPKPMLIVFGA